jgi:hypothetical protein
VRLEAALKHWRVVEWVQKVLPSGCVQTEGWGQEGLYDRVLLRRQLFERASAVCIGSRLCAGHMLATCGRSAPIGLEACLQNQAPQAAAAARLRAPGCTSIKLVATCAVHGPGLPCALLLLMVLSVQRGRSKAAATLLMLLQILA